MTNKHSYIPAAHYDFLTPFYGGFIKVFFGRRYKKAAQKIKLNKDEKLLDVGCGAGNMLRILHKMHPKSELKGLDIDPKILKIARKKLPESIQLHQSSATEIPEKDATFEVVISTMMIHHLKTSQKQKMIDESYRVLKPGGHFYLMDFKKPSSLVAKIFTKFFRHAENLDDAIEGKYYDYLKNSGFKEVKPIYQMYGMIEMLKGIK